MADWKYLTMKGITKKQESYTYIGGYNVVDLGKPEDPVQCCWNKEVLKSVHSSKALKK